MVERDGLAHRKRRTVGVNRQPRQNSLEQREAMQFQQQSIRELDGVARPSVSLLVRPPRYRLP